MIRKAAEKGLLVAMNPAWLGCCEGGWRDKLKTNGVAKCHAYGRFLGNRFKALDNLMWIHCGDRDPGPYLEEVRAIALGIKETAPQQLATAHPASTHSALDVFPNEAWLDVNATYTYAAEHVGAWRRQFHVYRNAKIDYLRQPPKPFFLIESTYEREHMAPPQKIRRQAYWACLSGAFGQAMGNGLIWPFKPGWAKELDSPASQQLSLLARLFRAHRWHDLVPDFDHKVLTQGYNTFNDGDQPGGNDYVTAAATPDGSLLLAYLPEGKSVTVDLGKFNAPVSARWFDPVEGEALPAAEGTLANQGSRKFMPPGSSDWVLVLTTNSSAIDSFRSSRHRAPAPLFRDPIHDGAADATLIWNRAEQCWWMLYTNRRADADDEKGVKWVHGTDLGIASTPDGGATWKYRGIARGLEFETNGTRNTFWAPEVVDFGGKYHAFISYVRGVPETWAGTRDILHYTSTNLLDWKFESIVVPGSIDACVHRLPDGRWRMWFKNEQKKIRGTVLDSDDLYTWKPTQSEMPDPDPGKGEGPDVFFWKGSFWMVKDMWRGLGVYRSPDLDSWKFMGVILDQPGKRRATHRIGQHPGRAGAGR